MPRLWNWLFEASVRVLAIAGARGVTRPERFALNELFLRRGVRRYTLRRSGRTVFIRHPMGDALAIHEVINEGVYLPPPQVGRVLDGIEKPRIVDLGAHIGTATLLLLERFPDAEILALEPQSDSAALLRRNIAVNGLEAQCEVRQAAAGTEAGTTVLAGSSFLAHVARDGHEEAVDLMPPLAKYVEKDARSEVEVVDILSLLEGAHFLKMDIEGAEWPILRDPRFAALGLSALVLEYHPQGAPEGDTFPALAAMLREAGFTVDVPAKEYGSSTGIAWAWRA